MTFISERIRLFAVVFVGLLSTAVVGCGTDPELRTPNPTFDSLAQGCGCAQFTVYRWSVARSECVVINAEDRELGLSTAPKTFDLSTANEWLHVSMEVYPSAVDDHHCSDVIYPNDPQPEIWRASAGTVTISVSSDQTPDCVGTTPDSFTATVTLHDVVFRSPDGGREVKVPEMVFDTVAVGWLPG